MAADSGQLCRAAALHFLEAYWRADLACALGVCAPHAEIDLPQSVSLPSPAPLAEVLPLIFANVYPRFVDGTFSIAVERILSDQRSVVVEYTASGPLVSGRTFHCRYLVLIEVVDGLVVRFRPYTDTKYIDAALFAPPP